MIYMIPVRTMMPMKTKKLMMMSVAASLMLMVMISMMGLMILMILINVVDDDDDHNNNCEETFCHDIVFSCPLGPIKDASVPSHLSRESSATTQPYKD